MRAPCEQHTLQYRDSLSTIGYTVLQVAKVIPVRAALHGMPWIVVWAAGIFDCTRNLDVWSDTVRAMGSRRFCYSWGTMSALNGDKARFNRERRAKLARRERSQAIRRKLKNHTPPRAAGTQL